VTIDDEELAMLLPSMAAGLDRCALADFDLSQPCFEKIFESFSPQCLKLVIEGYIWFILKEISGRGDGDLP
jgi:hypothetical protein